MEFSKKLLLWLMTKEAVILLNALVLAYLGKDTTVISYIVAGTDAELAVAIGFYYWKAKAENVIKLKIKQEVEL